AVAEIDGALTATASLGKPAGVILTCAAAGLPGMVGVLETRLGAILPPLPLSDDLGDSLISRPAEGVQVLTADALARAAHALAVRIHRGEAPSAHPEGIALPAMTPPRPDIGPPRLNFRGEDHPLM